MKLLYRSDCGSSDMKAIGKSLYHIIIYKDKKKDTLQSFQSDVCCNKTVEIHHTHKQIEQTRVYTQTRQCFCTFRQYLIFKDEHLHFLECILFFINVNNLKILTTIFSNTL